MQGAPDHLRRLLNITQITAASLGANAATLSTAMGDFNATRAVGFARWQICHRAFLRRQTNQPLTVVEIGQCTLHLPPPCG